MVVMLIQTWDLRLYRSKLAICCYELGAYVDAYYGEATLETMVDKRLFDIEPTGSAITEMSF